MALNNRLADRQAHTKPSQLISDIRLEYIIDYRVIYAGSIVFHQYLVEAIVDWIDKNLNQR